MNMSTLRSLALGLCALGLATASHAGSSPVATPAMTPKEEAFRFLSRVQYSGRQQDARSDDRDYRDDRYRPDDDRASRGTGHNGGDEGWRPGKGASFWLRVGDTRIGAKCPNGESMRACVDATLMLLD